MLQSTKKALPSRIDGANLDGICYFAKIIVAEFDINNFRQIVPALKGKCSHVRSLISMSSASRIFRLIYGTAVTKEKEAFCSIRNPGQTPYFSPP